MFGFMRGPMILEASSQISEKPNFSLGTLVGCRIQPKETLSNIYFTHFVGREQGMNATFVRVLGRDQAECWSRVTGC